MNTLCAIVCRDFRLFAARGSEAVATLFFFFAVAALFPFALAQEPGLLQKSAAAIIWVCALLAGLLSLETVFLRDAEDGTLDLLLMSPVSPLRIAFAKMLSHWLLSGAPLVAASFIVAIMLGVPPEKDSLSFLNIPCGIMAFTPLNAVTWVLATSLLHLKPVSLSIAFLRSARNSSATS